MSAGASGWEADSLLPTRNNVGMLLLASSHQWSQGEYLPVTVDEEELLLLLAGNQPPESLIWLLLLRQPLRWCINSLQVPRSRDPSASPQLSHAFADACLPELE